ncbi:hypothetical protein C3941_09105 [Kaistia algarum]|uniref:energy transducer TonB n=1 Tax=Kaistia algarum TaxID=2083279 RepID=UPI000CE8871C|nr:TonB family protein [Kaistia algarum]MCX5512218.1 TonB family protein [Kaistia algarum]PPE80312.1 hypothetical protein C3941_09105 [Kaistia algarum]
MLRRRWIVAIGLSFFAHAGLVLALTPSDEADIEAGSGAGSHVVGSVDAIIGIDMPVETPSEPEPAAALEPMETSETPAAEAEPPPHQMEVAALQPAEAAPAPRSDVTPLAATAEPTEASAANAPEVAAQPDSAETHSSEPAEIAASTPLEATTAPAIEADLAAAPTVARESEPVAAQASRETTEVAEVKASSTSETELQNAATATPTATEIQTAETAALATTPETAATTPAETLTAIEPAPPAQPKVKPEPKPERKIAKAKPVPVEKKAEKPAAPPRGSSETSSRKGAEIADADRDSTDPGLGRSREAGRGAALASAYAGRVSAKLRRARRYPDGTSERGTAHVAFSIGAGGTVSGLRIVASSGDGALDGAALDAVRRAAPFPPPPKAGFAIRVAIEFVSR